MNISFSIRNLSPNAGAEPVLTVNVGFSIGDEVLDSATVVDDDSTASSLSCANA